MYLGVYFSPPRFPSGTTASGVDLQVSTPATTGTVHVIKRKSPMALKFRTPTAQALAVVPAGLCYVSDARVLTRSTYFVQ